MGEANQKKITGNFIHCHGGPYDVRRLLPGDDRGYVTLADGRYVLIGDRWVWEGRS